MIFDGYSLEICRLLQAIFQVLSPAIVLPVFVLKSYLGKLLLEISNRIRCPFAKRFAQANGLILLRQFHLGLIIPSVHNNAENGNV